MVDESGLWPALKRWLGIRIAPAGASVTERNVAKTGLALILSGLGGLALVFTYGEPRVWSVAVTAVIVAAASLATGFLLGFVFGIPRSRRDTAPAAATATSTASPTATATGSDARPSVVDTEKPTPGTRAAASSSARLTVNANLEEISDWLTKIIVGIGLIELKNIPGRLDRIARYVAAGLVPTANATPPVTFALAIIVYFSVLGFLSGYLLTRLFLAAAFSAADDELERLRVDNENKSEEIERQKQRVSDMIQGADQSARRKAPLLSPSPQPPAAGVQPGSAADRLAALEVEYKSIRETHPPGEERTRLMTEVVSELAGLAPHLANFNVAAALASPQREVRLAAYAVIYAQPKPEYLEPLVDSLITYSAETRTQFDNRPFGEYWGIQAFDKVLSVTKSPLDPNVVNKVKTWASRLPKGTDRWFEMVRISTRYGIPAAV